MKEVQYTFTTKLGNMIAVHDGEYLYSLDFTDEAIYSTDEKNYRKLQELIFKEVHLFLEGKVKVFSIPIKPNGTKFQQRVWKNLLKINYGTTKTYGQIAKELFGKNYARAVAGAVGRNPLIFIVPCHRVVGANSLGGFSCGLDKKRFLLQLEMQGLTVH